MRTFASSCNDARLCAAASLNPPPPPPPPTGRDEVAAPSSFVTYLKVTLGNAMLVTGQTGDSVHPKIHGRR
ncbi:hypothetical protein [Streptomyces sp. NPDC059909]|uniref:hypothetical protein n=1 Tax=Streptomyces sp. NPDC059909 TaxID=3346998 RepID=UPI003666809D